MKQLILPAKIDQLDEVFQFIESSLEEYMLKPAFLISLNTCAEEIFVNIAHYAYPSKEGTATIQLSVPDDPKRVELLFIDSGIPYDPLMKPDADITLSAEDRAIGGLGILMVKRMMDDVSYEYIDGQNRLTMIKKFPV